MSGERDEGKGLTISKQVDGRYLVDVRPRGRAGKRMRRRFRTKNEAQIYERWIIATQNNKEWLAKTRADSRTLYDLVQLWWLHHGQALKSGAIIRVELERICYELGNPRADTFGKKDFSLYRARRLGAGISPATINREQSILSGVFSALKKADIYQRDNPMANMSRIKNPQKVMRFLSQAEIVELLCMLSGDNLKVARFCLATGARWDEAASLKASAVIKYKVTFNDTKGGKNRTVPVSPALYKEITQDGHKKCLFPGADYDSFRSMLKANFELPDGQATHVLRHTFASHFVMNGGNILTLQKILGHSNIQQTMTYAHLAPDYLQDAVRFNPLENYLFTSEE